MLQNVRFVQFETPYECPRRSVLVAVSNSTLAVTSGYRPLSTAKILFIVPFEQVTMAA